MRIAVVHNLPPGGQKRALDYQIKLLSRNHKVDIYSPSDFSYKYPPHFPSSVISIYFSLPDVYKLMAEKIDKKKYDVVYIQPCFLTQAPYVLRYLKTPTVYYCPEPRREFYETIPRKSNFFTYCVTLPFRYPIKYIDRENVSRATRILTNSAYSQELIKKIYKKDSYINYLGVDTDLFRNTSEVSLSLPVLTVGEMSLHKGHDFIIRSLSLIPEKMRPKLIIIGHGGSEKNYLLRLAERNKVKLELKEDISDRELVAIYNKVPVFIYASHREPFGMVLLEALACGLPVVAVSEGGVGEIVTNSRLGILVRRDEREFAREILKHIRQAQYKRVQEERTYRHEWVKKNWSWEKSVNELEKHLLGVAS